MSKKKYIKTHLKHRFLPMDNGNEQKRQRNIPAGSAGTAPKPEVIFCRLLEANINLLMGKCVNDEKIEEEVELWYGRGIEGPEWHPGSSRKNVVPWKQNLRVINIGKDL